MKRNHDGRFTKCSCNKCGFTAHAPKGSVHRKCKHKGPFGAGKAGKGVYQ